MAHPKTDMEVERLHRLYSVVRIFDSTVHVQSNVRPVRFEIARLKPVEHEVE